MTSSSVFPQDHIPSLDELIGLGREELYRLLGEAQRRQANLARIYGESLQGRAHYIDWCLSSDRALIRRALEEIEARRRSSSSAPNPHEEAE